MTNPPVELSVEYAPAVVAKFVELVLPTRYALPEGSTATPRASSSPVPPRYVEYTSAEPAAFSFATNASRQLPSAALLHVRRMAPPVVGKSLDPVDPAMMTLPEESTAMAFASSSPIPPRYVE